MADTYRSIHKTNILETGIFIDSNRQLGLVQCSNSRNVYVTLPIHHTISSAFKSHQTTHKKCMIQTPHSTPRKPFFPEIEFSNHIYGATDELLLIQDLPCVKYVKTERYNVKSCHALFSVCFGLCRPRS